MGPHSISFIPGRTMSTRANPTLRPAARVLLIDARDRLLLFRIIGQGADGTKTVWITPGGRLEDSESHEQAAQREIEEETGLRGIDLSPCVWERLHVFCLRDIWYESRERFFVACVERHTVSTLRHTPLEIEEIAEFRWWSLPEIARSREIFVPLNLGELLGPIIAGRLSGVPLQVGE